MLDSVRTRLMHQTDSKDLYVKVLKSSGLLCTHTSSRLETVISLVKHYYNSLEKLRIILVKYRAKSSRWDRYCIR